MKTATRFFNKPLILFSVAMIAFTVLSGCVHGYSRRQISEQLLEVKFTGDGTEKTLKMAELAEMIRTENLAPGDPVRVNSFKTLKKSLSSKSKFVRAGAVKSLARGWGAKSLDAIIPMLIDPDDVVKSSAIKAMIEYPALKIIEPLGAFLKSKQPEDIKVLAVKALRETGDPKATGSIIGILETADDKLLYYATEALEHMTGNNFGTNRTRWIKWWNSRGQE